MKTEQQMIDGLRKRKKRITLSLIALGLSTAMLILSVITYSRGISRIREMSTIQASPIQLSNGDTITIPEIIVHSVELSALLSRVYSLSVLIAALVGVFIALVLVELFGLSKDRILIRLWDEIDSLKKDRDKLNL
jgi:hypothetical protein